jgi:hypothetical protein
MNIKPNSNIAIGGRHCPAGVSFEVADSVAVELIAQGIAVRVKVIETADAVPEVESPEKRKRSKR